MLGFSPLSDKPLSTTASSGGGAATAYTLSGDTGSYSYSGGASTLKANRKLSGATGSYSYSGGDATLTYSGSTSTNYTLSGVTGSYSYSGSDATLTYTSIAQHLTLIADTGAYSYQGSSAELVYSGTLKPAGWYEEKRKRKKNIVKADGKVYEFGSIGAAASFLNLIGENNSNSEYGLGKKKSNKPAREIIDDELILLPDFGYEAPRLINVSFGNYKPKYTEYKSC